MAQIRIRDDQEYQKYLVKAREIFKRYHGEYLAVDDHPLVLEGKWNCTRAVLIRFDTKDDFNAWYYSDDYQEILKYRMKASDSTALLMDGFN
jgi:uncharacterized protein (DUF1330 family)